MVDSKISDMTEATSLTSYIFTGIQGGTNKKLPVAVLTDYVDDAIETAIDAIPTGGASGGTPVGAIMDYAGSTAPTGWLLCYGQAISRTTYADLFTAISTAFGSGDGSTTFNLPDARGRVVAGKDNMGGTSANRLTNQSGGVEGDNLGATGGAETHTLTSTELAPHVHVGTYSSTATGPYASITGGNIGFGNGAGVQFYTGSAGSGGAHNNVQPTIVFNKIIYTGVA